MACNISILDNVSYIHVCSSVWDHLKFSINRTCHLSSSELIVTIYKVEHLLDHLNVPVNGTWHIAVCVLTYSYVNFGKYSSRINPSQLACLSSIWTQFFQHWLLANYFAIAWVTWFQMMNLCKVYISKYFSKNNSKTKEMVLSYTLTCTSMKLPVLPSTYSTDHAHRQYL